MSLIKTVTHEVRYRVVHEHNVREIDTGQILRKYCCINSLNNW